jgi:glutamine---fructose-6-phosphate transaminase (isomerizing)
MPSEILGLLDQAVAATTLTDAATLAAQVDALLKGVPGVHALIGRHELVAAITARLDQIDGRAGAREAELEADGVLTPDELEAANAELIAVRDALWAVRKDRLRTAEAVAALAGRDAGEAAVAAYLSVQQALSAIDRLEVRGRDSAGLHLYVWNHGLSPADPAVAAALRERQTDPLFQSGSVRVAAQCFSFVYKAAAEIGELGDNTAAFVAAARARRTSGKVCRARPHPLGQRRHHQRAELPSAEQRGTRAARRRPAAIRRCRAER